MSLKRRRESGLRLAASVEAMRESLGISISIPFWDALLERYLGPAREQLGADADAVWADGRALEFDEAIALAPRFVRSPARAAVSGRAGCVPSSRPRARRTGSRAPRTRGGKTAIWMCGSWP